MQGMLHRTVAPNDRWPGIHRAGGRSGCRCTFPLPERCRFRPAVRPRRHPHSSLPSPHPSPRPRLRSSLYRWSGFRTHHALGHTQSTMTMQSPRARGRERSARARACVCHRVPPRGPNRPTILRYPRSKTPVKGNLVRPAAPRAQQSLGPPRRIFAFARTSSPPLRARCSRKPPRRAWRRFARPGSRGRVPDANRRHGRLRLRHRADWDPRASHRGARPGTAPTNRPPRRCASTRNRNSPHDRRACRPPARPSGVPTSGVPTSHPGHRGRCRRGCTTFGRAATLPSVGVGPPQARSPAGPPLWSALCRDGRRHPVRSGAKPLAGASHYPGPTDRRGPGAQRHCGRARRHGVADHAGPVG